MGESYYGGAGGAWGGGTTVPRFAAHRYRAAAPPPRKKRGGTEGTPLGLPAQGLRPRCPCSWARRTPALSWNSCTDVTDPCAYTPRLGGARADGLCHGPLCGLQSSWLRGTPEGECRRTDAADHVPRAPRAGAAPLRTLLVGRARDLTDALGASLRLMRASLARQRAVDDERFVGAYAEVRTPRLRRRVGVRFSKGDIGRACSRVGGTLVESAGAKGGHCGRCCFAADGR